MTDEESLLIVEYLNRKASIPSTSQKLVAMRACADEIRRRLRDLQRSISEYVWITSDYLILIDKKGVKYKLQLQKGSAFHKRVQSDTWGEEKFFLADKIKWTRI